MTRVSSGRPRQTPLAAAGRRHRRAEWQWSRRPSCPAEFNPFGGEQLRKLLPPILVSGVTKGPIQHDALNGSFVKAIIDIDFNKVIIFASGACPQNEATDRDIWSGRGN